jgi:hypothetical protein
VDVREFFPAMWILRNRARASSTSGPSPVA